MLIHADCIVNRQSVFSAHKRHFSYIAFSIALASLPSQISAQTGDDILSADEIEALCTVNKDRPDVGPLGQAIRRAHENLFEENSGDLISIADRDPDEYLEDLQRIIRASSYSDALTCIDEAVERGFEVTHDIGEHDKWSLSFQPYSKKATINIEVIQNIHYSSTVYLHEVLHLCQSLGERRTALVDSLEDRPTPFSIEPGSAPLEEQIKERRTERDKLLDDITRLRMLGEIESNYAELIFYSEAVQASPLMCERPIEGDYKFYEYQISLLEELSAGFFASSILADYADDLDYKDNPNAYYDLSSSSIYYYFSHDDTFFKTIRLSDAMKQEVEALGIIVNENGFNNLVVGPKPALKIQEILKYAGCYTGEIDNIWGNGSKEALRRLGDAAGVTFDTETASVDLYNEAIELIHVGEHRC